MAAERSSLLMKTIASSLFTIIVEPPLTLVAATHYIKARLLEDHNSVRNTKKQNPKKTGKKPVMCLSLEITLKYMLVRCAIVKLHCYNMFRMLSFPHSAKQHTFVIQ